MNKNNVEKLVKSGLIVAAAIVLAPVVIEVSVALTVVSVAAKMIDITGKLVNDQFKTSDQQVA